MWARCWASMKRWWALIRPVSARSSSGSLRRSCPAASSASAAASSAPATSSASIARAETPVTSLTTLASLMLAPSSVFCRRLTSAVRSRTRLLR